MSLGLLVSVAWVFVAMLLGAMSRAHEMLVLNSNSFEVSITAYQYLAILFYDSSQQGELLEYEWDEAAVSLQTLSINAQMAKILGTEPELKEIIDAYGIPIPSVLVFRNGILMDYQGPLHDSEAIAAFIKDDARPSIQFLASFDEIRGVLRKGHGTGVVGFFSAKDARQDSELDEETTDEWSQFQAVADTLRGNMNFYVVTSPVLLEPFGIQEEDLPAVYLFSDESGDMSRYTGPMVDTSLTEWLLRNLSPRMGELSLSSAVSQQYTAQFFTSRKLKFILFLPDDHEFRHVVSGNDPGSMVTRNEVLYTWEQLSKQYREQAIFSFMSTSSNPITDIVAYFDVDLANDIPCVVAHNPSQDGRYKSQRLRLQSGSQEVAEYVNGVVTGSIAKLLRSEPIPKKQRSLAVKVVGKNVIRTVSQSNTDVLLAVYASYQANTKQMMHWLEMLAKAVQGDKRIIVARIDASLNDLPPSWGVSAYPTLLWFPAKDKEQKHQDESDESLNANVAPTPRPYWNAGVSLPELIAFVTRESSFDKHTLRVASSEQVIALQQDEEMYRLQYEEEDRYERRNEGRQVYEQELVDYLLGEIVYDGKRWHVVVGGIALVWAAVASCVVVVLLVSRSPSTGSSKAKQA